MPQNPIPPKPAPAKPPDEEEYDVFFKKGETVETSEFKWNVVKLLGEGGFVLTYLVNGKDEAKAVLKVPSKIESEADRRKAKRLKMEVAVLKKITPSKHFTKMIDRGRKEESKEHEAYCFLVTQLVGKNLHELKSSRAQNVFSFATALGVAHQCLESLQELHKHGYIHRNLKPQNFACGLFSEKHVIYILDFGLARKYVDSNNELKIPRNSVGFKGNSKFASIACHRGEEISPKDDCESWFYMLIDFASPTGLPWKKVGDKNETLREKEEICHGRTDNPLYGNLKHTKEFAKILGYICQLEYQDRVDYSFIYKLLARAGKSAQVNIDAPYDWETSATST